MLSCNTVMMFWNPVRLFIWAEVPAFVRHRYVSGTEVAVVSSWRCCSGLVLFSALLAHCLWDGFCCDSWVQFFFLYWIAVIRLFGRRFGTAA